MRIKVQHQLTARRRRQDRSDRSRKGNAKQRYAHNNTILPNAEQLSSAHNIQSRIAHTPDGIILNIRILEATCAVDVEAKFQRASSI